MVVCATTATGFGTGFAPMLKESLANAIVSKKPNVKWDDIAGLEAAKKVLHSGDIMSKWFGESEKLVRQLFVMVRQKKPAIIFIDKIDALCSSREGPGGANEHTARMKTELLIQMQGLDSENDGLVVLAVTNLPWALDPAARRRFQKRIYVPLPDRKAREDLFRIHSGGGILADDELSALARETDGFSASDIHNFVEEALRVPLDKIHAATHFKKVGCRGSELYAPCDPREGGSAMTWEGIPKDKLKEPRVTAEEFFQILRDGKVKSTVGSDELGEYKKWTETYGMEGK
ncbi:P-loop containing nucleoside triphosphate hydrolase protein [Chaetomium tenue]|uniref:P-loop containing nucleoside triphosphate hydrolase protein n=1 Tax=Chaetomium tenue TaxID=1854479 RepID=A0ACB7PDC7_9PEZI|nr:P-loop containing nucleoside triphosphate hydrolase protein [Chaetomium globosum]